MVVKLNRVTRERPVGYGCTCPSFKLSPDPLVVIKALARSVGWLGSQVRVSNRREYPDGRIEWDATSGNDVYSVTYSPDAPGGFCKHIASVQESAWMKTGCIGAKEVLIELEDVTRKLKYVTKELDKWKKSS